MSLNRLERNWESAESSRTESLKLTGKVESTSTAGLLEAARQRIDAYEIAGRGDDENLIPSLHAFLDYLPEGGREAVARDVVNSGSDQALWAVYNDLLTGLALPMKSLSRESAVMSEEMELEEPDAHDPVFQEMCLRRDGKRCVVSKVLDTNHWVQLGWPSGVDNTTLEATHIIPLAYASYNFEGPGQPCDSSWDVLFRCFPTIQKTGMSSDRINESFNGLTLRDNMHARFGKFMFAFQATDTENMYKIKTYANFPPNELKYLPESRMVRFQQAEDASDLALPDPVLLDCHFRMAEILNASGMGDIIDRHFQDWEYLKEVGGKGSLREDGNSNVESFLRAGLWAYDKG